jgi:DNA-binding response OmpR family regulator
VNDKKILLVEDDESLSSVLKQKMSSAGFQISTAFNGLEALDFIQKKKQSFDLVLLDLMMPEMDGFEVLAKLKKSNTKIPVIVLTNLGQKEDFTKVKNLGAVDYIVKINTTPQEVLKKVQNFLQ